MSGLLLCIQQHIYFVQRKSKKANLCSTTVMTIATSKYKTFLKVLSCQTIDFSDRNQDDISGRKQERTNMTGLLSKEINGSCNI